MDSDRRARAADRPVADAEGQRSEPARTHGPAASGLPSEHALLGLLALSGGTAHGYDLARQFRQDRLLGDVIRLEPAMLYKTLKKMERAGWIETTLEEQPPRPPRRVGRLTPAGRAELRRWLTEPVGRTREVRLGFLVKLFFARRLDPQLARRLLTDQRAVLLALAASLADQLDRLDAGVIGAPSAPNLEDVAFRRLVIELRLSQTEAAAAWLERVAEEPLP